ncbi:MAG: hypothetical protein AAF555_02165 [Verrucomicrobiota bacterium]
MSSEKGLDLNTLDLMPDWAKAPAETSKYENYEAPPERKGRDGDRRREPGGGGGSRGPRPERASNRRREGPRDRQERRPQRGAGRPDRQEPRFTPLPQLPNFRLRVKPKKAGIIALAEQIKKSGRAFPAFDLARLVLGGKDRYWLHFEQSPKPEGKARTEIYRCQRDGSLWLSKTEALRHLWKADWFGDFYRVHETETEGPKGSFQAVAVCGLSGELICPPNYHDYQTLLAKRHREHFSRMPFERYKSKVELVRDEEKVAEWVAQMKTQKQWFPAPPKPEKAKEAAASEGEPATEAPLAPSEESPSPPESAAPVESTPLEASEPKFLLATSGELERHFAENHFEKVFDLLPSSRTSGEIPGKLLSPDLLQLVKGVTERLRKNPMDLVKILCQQLEAQGIRFFKFGGIVYASHVRPKYFDDSTPVSDRLRSILTFLKGRKKTVLKDIVDALQPGSALGTPTAPGEEAPKLSEEEVHLLRDVRWLLQEGLVSQFEDGSLAIVHKQPRTPKAQGNKPKEDAHPAASASAKEAPTPAAEDSSEPRVN